MIERPHPDDETALPGDAPANDDVAPKPRPPQPAKVTPLDPDEKIKEGIEVNET